MNLINREKDNILSIAKSLRPLKYLYSKQNKDFDKFFRGSNLKDFVRQINSQKKYSFFLEPGEDLNEFQDKYINANLMFKNPFNYYDELSSLKKIPFSIAKKSNRKASRYHSEDNKNNRSKKKESKEKKIIKLKKSCNDDDNMTLDPGRYNPNYNYIKRRYPCAFLGRPKKKEDSLNKAISEREQEKESEDKKETKNNTEEETKNEITEKNSNDKSIKSKRNEGLKEEEKKNKKLLTFYSHRTIENKQSRDLKYRKINKIKCNIFKNIKANKNKLEENEKIKSLSQRKLRRTTNLSIKLKSTVSSWSNLNYLYTEKKDKNNTRSTSNIPQFKNKRLFKRNKNDLLRKISCENMRATVKFDRMPGRDTHMNFSQGVKNEYVIDYHPNYNYVKPHVPSTFFKSQRKYDDIKKYVTGKIIRSYTCNPGEYFVFDFNNFKENELNEKFWNL